MTQCSMHECKKLGVVHLTIGRQKMDFCSWQCFWDFQNDFVIPQWREVERKLRFRRRVLTMLGRNIFSHILGG